MKTRWSDHNPAIGPPYQTFHIGPFKFGSVTYNSLRPRGDTENQYRARCEFGGKTWTKEGIDREQLQNWVEGIFRGCLKAAGLQFKEEQK